MSKDILEIGDVWENDNYELIATKVWSDSFFANVTIRNKKNGSFSEESTNLRDIKQYHKYKGKAKHLPETWYEVE